MLEDVDLDEAVEGANRGLFSNQGQSCCAGSRVFVEETIYDRFVEKSISRASKRVVGNPFDPRTELGPLVDESQLDKVTEYIKSGRDEGATLAWGGERIGDRGYFIQPAVFSDVHDDMKIASEEIFGPVMSVIPFKSLDEVDFSSEPHQIWLGRRCLHPRYQESARGGQQRRAGTVWVNCYNVLDTRAPFGA